MSQADRRSPSPGTGDAGAVPGAHGLDAEDWRASAVGKEGGREAEGSGPPPRPYRYSIQRVSSTYQTHLLRCDMCNGRWCPRSWGQRFEFIPLSFWYDAPLTERYRDRRHVLWLVYDSLTCSSAQ